MVATRGLGEKILSRAALTILGQRSRSKCCQHWHKVWLTRSQILPGKLAACPSDEVLGSERRTKVASAATRVPPHIVNTCKGRRRVTNSLPWRSRNCRHGPNTSPCASGPGYSPIRLLTRILRDIWWLHPLHILTSGHCSISAQADKAARSQPPGTAPVLHQPLRAQKLGWKQSKIGESNTALL